MAKIPAIEQELPLQCLMMEALWSLAHLEIPMEGFLRVNLEPMNMMEQIGFKKEPILKDLRGTDWDNNYPYRETD